MIRLTIFKKWSKVALFLFFAVFISANLKAQFSYTGVRLSYHNVRFDEGVDMEGTRINDLVANIDFVHRPLRNFGIGVSARLPILHGFKYMYMIEGNYADQIAGGGTFGEREVSFAGGDLEYNIQNTFSLSLFGRIYFDIEKNYFLDLRYTFESYKETFNFSRENNGNLRNDNIRHEETVLAKGVGFSVGYQPKIGDHFYFTYAFTVDFLGYDGVSFNHNIQRDHGSYKENVNVRSKIDDTQTAYEFSAGVGYVF